MEFELHALHICVVAILKERPCLVMTQQFFESYGGQCTLEVDNDGTLSLSQPMMRLLKRRGAA